MSDDSGAVEVGDSGAGTALHYSLGVFYLLLATFIMILAWVIPSIVISASVTFTLIGAIIFVSAIVQIVFTSELASTLCTKCPPPAPM